MAHTTSTDRFVWSSAGALRSGDAVGGLAVAVGSFSVVLTSLFYLLSAPGAVAPVLVAYPDAVAAAAGSATTMRIAGTSGVFGNLVMAIGCLMLAIGRVQEGRPVTAAGWAACVMSIVVFEVVDGLTGFVLAPAAADPTGAAAFNAFRNLYAVFFLVGTAFFGLGALLILTDREEVRLVGTWVAVLGLANGALGLLAVLGALSGWPVERVVGATVAVGAVLFVVVGLRIATRTTVGVSELPSRDPR